MLINLQTLIEKHNILPMGIIHIGAHLGEESVIYKKCNIHRVLWIEGNPDLISPLRNNVSNYKNHLVLQAVVSDTDEKTIQFKIATDSQASSIFHLETHKIHHPSIFHNKNYEVKTTTLDSLLKKEQLKLIDYNFLNLDIQGAEFLALKGATETLKEIDYIYTEINITQLYKGTVMLSEIDKLLGENNFIREEMKMTEFGWGDAFYIKKSHIPKQDILSKIQEAKSLETEMFKIESKSHLKRIKSYLHQIKNWINL